MIELNKIYNEDCLSILRQFPDKSVDMLLQDPPYGTTKLEWDRAPDLSEMWPEWLRVIKDNGAMVFTASQPFTTDLINSQRKLFRYEIIWEKTMPNGFLDANRKPLKCHENILIFYKKQPVYNPQKTMADTNSIRYKRRGGELGGHYNKFGTQDAGTADKKRHPISVIRFSNWNGAIFGDTTKAVKHPTQKPVDLFRWLIRTYTNEGDLVFDGYSGSGTTAMASIMEGRKFICTEVNEKYWSDSVNRINDTTRQATLFAPTQQYGQQISLLDNHEA